MNEKFESSTAPEPVGLYPHSRRVGNLLFLSGVGPRKRGTKEIPGVVLDGDGNVESYDIESQCRSVFENVKTIVTESGSSWKQIVDVTVFLTNMECAEVRNVTLLVTKLCPNVPFWSDLRER